MAKKKSNIPVKYLIRRKSDQQWSANIAGTVFTSDREKAQEFTEPLAESSCTRFKKLYQQDYEVVPVSVKKPE